MATVTIPTTADASGRGHTVTVGPRYVSAATIEDVRSRQSADRQSAMAARIAATKTRSDRKSARAAKYSPLSGDAGLVSALLAMPLTD